MFIFLIFLISDAEPDARDVRVVDKTDMARRRLLLQNCTALLGKADPDRGE